MSVLSCTLARDTPDLIEDDKFQNTVRVTWNIESDDPTDGPLAIKLGARSVGPNQLPDMWTAYRWPGGGETDLSIFLRSLQVRRRHGDSSMTQWVAVGDYRPTDPGQQSGDGNTNPLLRPTKYRIEHTSYTRVVEEDRDEKPVVNSAGQKFDDPMEEELSRMVLVAQKNYATLQEIINLNLAFGGKMNSDNYRGVGPRRWFCHTIPASDIQVESGVEFYTAEFRLELNFETWDRRILNMGWMHYISATNKTLVDATDDKGRPVPEPIKLELDGTRRDDDLDAELLTFRTKDEVAFSGLGV